GGLVFCSAGSVLESQLSLEQKWLGSTLLFPPPEETVIFALWTQPSPKYPVHSRGVLCCYVTTFSNCTSCTAQTLLCATQTWWHFLLHVVAYQFLVRICTFQFDGFTFVAQLPSYLYLHPSDQKDSSKPLKQCTQGLRQGVGMAMRKMGSMAKPDVYIIKDGDTITVKTESTFKTSQFSFKLGEKFEENTLDGRKTQTLVSLKDDGSLIQEQEWDGKKTIITRKLVDGQLVVECDMNGVKCVRVYQKA
uniref:Fatty acid binding protein 5 n=1 Tax=Buteo japonicus TaxID=224669 RepID=A0A8B9Z8P9_9AVES